MGFRRALMDDQANPAWVQTANFAKKSAFGGNKFEFKTPISALANAN